MIVTMNPNMFDINDVYYCKPIRNKIMNGGWFMRIIYSNDIVSINGIHLVFSISGKITEVYSNKYKFIFDGNYDTPRLINKIKEIENVILSNCDFKDKTPCYKLRDQLEQNFFKFFQSTQGSKTHVKTNNPVSFSIKISGIWTTDTTYGITYKFTKV